jgi:hypothetical protein
VGMRPPGQNIPFDSCDREESRGVARILGECRGDRGYGNPHRRSRRLRDTMVIACLGWGSLIWNPGGLPICSEWRIDGPPLPVEFARQSANGRITLVIAEDTVSVPVLWAALDVESLERARKVLAQREGVKTVNVDSAIGAWSPTFSSGHSECRIVAPWAVASGVSGVVWTALRSKFADQPVKPSCDQVVRYLATLEGETRRLAEEYIRSTPAQIRTPYRERIERELGWTAV